MNVFSIVAHHFGHQRSGAEHMACAGD